MNYLETLKTKEIAFNHLVYNRIKLYKECIEMLEEHDPNGSYWEIIEEVDYDYDKAMEILQECVSRTIHTTIKDKDTAQFYIKVLSKAIKY
jgi:hypothetical protein